MKQETELFKKYRPQKFSEIFGNKSEIDALTKRLAKGTVPHSILFTGSKGTGKTTTARILAKELGATEMGLVSLNSANFTGVDTVREIQEAIKYPCMTGGPKIWIMEEFHRATPAAQDAALVMTEFTPPNVYFFFCTNEPRKIDEALRSRCHPIELKSLNEQDMEALLDHVLKLEKQKVSAKHKQSIIAAAEGSSRVALVLLEKILFIDEQEREAVLGKKHEEESAAIDLCRALIKQESWARVSAILKTLSVEPETVRHAVLGYARKVLLNDGKWEAYNVIRAFENNFYDSKEAGLAAAAYDAIHLIQNDRATLDED